MKTAIYIEEGVMQMVVTPETDFEKKLLAVFSEGEIEAQVFTGSFYDSRGGWVRQADYHFGHPWGRDEKSLILKLGKGGNEGIKN